MRLLCIDHYFEQDIEAMELAAGPHHCWSIHFERFYRPAREVFDDEVLTGIEAYFRPEHERDRQRFAAIAREEVHRLYRTYRFDAILAPSDTFFWIRAVIEACHELGIPVAVLQKEATIPPGWLEGPAQEWCSVSPFVADHMMVSSANHRQFWVNGGVDPEIVVVTGQPRFDIYAHRRRQSSWSDLGVPLDPSLPSVLFLTYDKNAYLPIIDRSGLAPWTELRDQTEEVLLDLARAGTANVLLKGHPQPSEDQTVHLDDLARTRGVFRLDPRADVRRLIVSADVVVGFQTTALMEALAAGRPTVYTWWTEATRQYEPDLIPFHRERDALTVAESPRELGDAIRSHIAAPRSAPSGAGTQLVERFLGPIDGAAAQRCWSELQRLVERRTASPKRLALDRSRRLERLPRTVAAASAVAAWALADSLPAASYPLYRAAARLRHGEEPLPASLFRREVQSRRRGARERLMASAG